MEIYMDHAATTRPFSCVQEVMLKTLQDDFGNPSSMHRKGIRAEQYVKKAQDQIAKTLKCQPKEIIFTSGGTEANNMAIIGTALSKQRQGKHLITTAMEHPSVYEPMYFLQEMGFEVTFLPVDIFGRVKIQDLIHAMRDDTILISIMYVNNEIGSMQDIAALSKAAKEKKADVIFHVDAIQAYGKMVIHPKKEGIDLLSVSGHKIHGPKGIGFLYQSDQIHIKPILYGGGQQKGMRSGTENVPGIAGLGAAAEQTYQNLEQTQADLYEKKAYFIERLFNIKEVTINGICMEQGISSDTQKYRQNLLEAVKQTAPHIISVSFAGVRSEVLLHALEDKRIYVSSGSACSSNHPQQSSTLQAIGVKKELLDSTIRFSLGAETSREEIDYVIEKLENLLPMLRKFIRK